MCRQLRNVALTLEALRYNVAATMSQCGEPTPAQQERIQAALGVVTAEFNKL